MASILIVEDHPTMRDAMRLVLEEDGHQVEEASDGEVGIAMVRDRAPDVVLLDLNIPVVSGAEVLETLKSDSGHGRRPGGRRHGDGGGGTPQGDVAGCRRLHHEAVQPARPAPLSGAGTSRSRAVGIVTVNVAPSPRIRFQGDPAPHRLRQLPRDVEAEPGALRVGRRGFGLMEAIEDRIALVRVTPARRLAPRTSPCLRSGIHPELDLRIPGELDGVHRQVREDLDHPLAVDDEVRRMRRGPRLARRVRRASPDPDTPRPAGR